MTPRLVVGVAAGLVCAASLIGCGETGGARFSFSAAAAGPEGASGGPMTFDNALGYRVTLTRARVRVGALYLNQTRPTSGMQAASCLLPGIYVAQVTGGLDVDALQGAPQPFPIEGEALAAPSSIGEVWLTGGPIDAIEDTSTILDVAGEATRSGVSWPFEGRLTIGQNRAIPPTNPAQPGARPLCKQRIVSNIPARLELAESGSLLVRAEPSVWFGNVDFASLARVDGAAPLYRFADAAVAPADISLYGDLRSQGAWAFTWKETGK